MLLFRLLLLLLMLMFVLVFVLLLLVVLLLVVFVIVLVSVSKPTCFLGPDDVIPVAVLSIAALSLAMSVSLALRRLELVVDSNCCWSFWLEDIDEDVYIFETLPPLAETDSVGVVISTTSIGTENTGSFFSLSSRSIDEMIFSLA